MEGATTATAKAVRAVQDLAEEASRPLPIPPTLVPRSGLASLAKSLRRSEEDVFKLGGGSAGALTTRQASPAVVTSDGPGDAGQTTAIAGIAKEDPVVSWARRRQIRRAEEAAAKTEVSAWGWMKLTATAALPYLQPQQSIQPGRLQPYWDHQQ
ncbi:hypothetical protein HK405_011174 [Cladochytrium tenue]|nr:hypothetical protein HK405_011174 [Cladochytrium tenue]